jgi:hypothetical protein
MRGARRTLGVAPVKKVAATSGFLTPSPLAGACLFKMMDVSRHKSVDTLRAMCATRPDSGITPAWGYCEEDMG